jgi:hypothetical protein
MVKTTRTATATADGQPTKGGGSFGMAGDLWRKTAEQVAKLAEEKASVEAVKGSPLKGVGTATPNGGSAARSGSFGLAADTWKLAAEKAGINVDELSQTEKDILRTGGVKAYQEYLWEDERAKAKK